MKLASVDIRRLISLVGKSAARKAEERGVILIVNPPENLPLVQADAEKISWVVTQLLDNEIKFTPLGGTVTVTVVEEGHNLVQIMVIDTGIGIPQSRMQEVFEPFHQLDGSSTRRFGGAGLGLSLVRQIVEAHGSLLDIKSAGRQRHHFQIPTACNAGVTHAKRNARRTRPHFSRCAIKTELAICTGCAFPFHAPFVRVRQRGSLSHRPSDTRFRCDLRPCFGSR